MERPTYTVILERSRGSSASKPIQLRDILPVLEEYARDLIWEVVDWDPYIWKGESKPSPLEISQQYDAGVRVFLTWGEFRSVAADVEWFTDSCFAGWESKEEAQEIDIPLSLQEVHRRATLVLEDHGYWMVVTRQREIVEKLKQAFPDAFRLYRGE